MTVPMKRVIATPKPVEFEVPEDWDDEQIQAWLERRFADRFIYGRVDAEMDSWAYAEEWRN